MKPSIFIIFAFLALSANAGTTACSSTDGKFRYTYTQSDGGPFMAPSTIVEVDGVTVIAHSPRGGAEIRSAELTWEPKSTAVKKTTDKKYETTYYLQDAKVESKEKGVLFDNTVFCSAQKYIGIPIP